MHILLLTRFERLGSASRVRYYQYLPYLEAHGVNITISSLLTDEYITRLYTGQRQKMSAFMYSYFKRVRALLQSHTYDLIWLEKESLPWLPAWLENLFSRTSIVVDYDDAIFHRYDQHPSPLIRGLLSRKIDAVMRHAAVVVVGNDYLAAHAQKAGAKRIEFLPSVVDTTRYQPTNQLNNQFNHPFTIGWIGAPVTAPYLQLIQPALHELCARGDVHVIQVGGGNLALEGVHLENHPWTEAIEVTEIQNFDVGIMPLPDQPFERGKCGYKLIQYMACALPVVASPVGVNQSLIEHGVNGFLATTPKEWVEALTTLQQNPALRRQMGLVGRKKVEQFYSLQTNAPKLLNLLQNVERRT